MLWMGQVGARDGYAPAAARGWLELASPGTARPSQLMVGLSTSIDRLAALLTKGILVEAQLCMTSCGPSARIITCHWHLLYPISCLHHVELYTWLPCFRARSSACPNSVAWSSTHTSMLCDSSVATASPNSSLISWRDFSSWYKQSAQVCRPQRNGAKGGSWDSPFQEDRSSRCPSHRH
jgi:hypothetical protein